MTILTNTFLNFAQAYGEGVYNSGTYGGGNSAGGGAASSNAGGLANTGFAIALVLTAACLIIFTALVVRFARRKSNVSS